MSLRKGGYNFLFYIIAVPLTFSRHSGVGRKPVVSTTFWIPAYVGMTEGCY